MKSSPNAFAKHLNYSQKGSQRSRFHAIPLYIPRSLVIWTHCFGIGGALQRLLTLNDLIYWVFSMRALLLCFDCIAPIKLNRFSGNELTFFICFFGCASLQNNFLKYYGSCFNSTLNFGFAQCGFVLLETKNGREREKTTKWKYWGNHYSIALQRRTL